jgi:hypothetical protein
MSVDCNILSFLKKTGLLAPPQDVPAFAAAIDRILQNPEWAQKLGKGGRKRVESKFSWDGVATQLSELYTELLQPQSVSPTAMELVQSTVELVQSTAKGLVQSTAELVQSTAKQPVKELVQSTNELVQSPAKKPVLVAK